MDAASKHDCFILLLAKHMLLRGSIDKLGGQDARYSGCQIRCHLDRVMLWDAKVLLREGCVFLQAEDISQPHRCHSRTDEVPCYFTALDGSIRVLYSLLDVRTAEEGGQLCELRRP